MADECGNALAGRCKVALGSTSIDGSAELRRWQTLLATGITHSCSQVQICGISLSRRPIRVLVVEGAVQWFWCLKGIVRGVAIRENV